MLINHRYQFLYVHIPKTAGGSFRTYNRKNLSRWWRKDYEEVGAAHAPITPEIAERFKDYTKFTIVRNPWKLIASAYRFETEGVSQDREGNLRKRDILLLDWLEEHVAESRIGPFPSQLGYSGHNGRILLDRFVRQDDIVNEMRKLMLELGAPFDAKAWESPQRHYYGDYDWRSYFKAPEVVARVEELCRADFEYFGWSRDDLK